MEQILVAVGLIAVVAVIIRVFVRRETVYEYESGLLFSKGLLRRTLPPGQRWFLKTHSMIQKVDMRLRTVSVPSQEVLSSDNVTIKVTLAAQYSVTDPVIALTKVEKFQDAFYMLLQLALRELVGGMQIDDVVSKRQELGKSIYEQTKVKARDLGLTLHLVDIKDIMFPGDLKKIFAQVVNAQKEGQASLERARGETAALRSLANAAKLLEGNPALMQLRFLQSVDAGTGNTVVLGLPSDVLPLPLKKQGKTTAISEALKTEAPEKKRSSLTRKLQRGRSADKG